MLKLSKFGFFFLATLISISFAKTVNADPTSRLTVVVNGVQHQKGQLCFRIYSSEEGFPFSDTSEVQSGCTQIKGSSGTKQFYGLKPGTYAVAVIDDQNGNHKLDTNFLGIPQEGFGISKNPTVSISTGAPKFQQASFSLRKDITIKIFMKYSLDS
ncbi:DUF2141 domain-containing protein [Aetokthonos hydrillicola Thurmond2011]|uniref:DUF2141 domain-containing protein n=1 Tax=Aetokthonos hydrillicola Thurmond2011 TaxID=2712845 RepID=A0AAP5I9K6_9CYAN|nr:DUF2141 domain-containing protein [Aetokthonos hydrillicola]MBW4586288.1 DUF2141 domain-containing protein [Aetokthonos hydrillicola CCALA 1050]MDR9897416.1 DUF2141 domain-containing protein [Aetokthonos hydrillicola Thurmond2011]